MTHLKESTCAQLRFADNSDKSCQKYVLFPLRALSAQGSHNFRFSSFDLFASLTGV